MTIGGATQVYALAGSPVAHSLSPAIYNGLFAHDGVDAVYVAFEVAPEAGAGLASALRTLGLAGANLTVPHKAAILPDLDVTDPAVEAAGAANVVVARDGALHGYNTDGEGFCRAFEERFGSVPEAPAIVLGAGGAARAVAAALVARGVPEVGLLNRTETRARAACEHLAAYHPGARWRAAALGSEAFSAAARSAGLVVNATPAGARERVGSLPVDALPDGAIWVDLNYWDPEPPALAACEARGLRTQRGLDMLIHQAALAYTLFTGRPADPVLIRGLLG